MTKSVTIINSDNSDHIINVEVHQITGPNDFVIRTHTLPKFEDKVTEYVYQNQYLVIKESTR